MEQAVTAKAELKNDFGHRIVKVSCGKCNRFIAEVYSSSDFERKCESCKTLNRVTIIMPIERGGLPRMPKNFGKLY